MLWFKSRAVLKKKKSRLIQKNKRSKRKKFSEMDPKEKKERIDYLWKLFRFHVNQMKFVRRTQKDIENQFLTNFAQKSFDGIKSQDKFRKKRDNLPWYLLREKSKGMQAFKSLLGIFFYVQFSLNVFKLSLYECIPVEYAITTRVFTTTVEVLFVIDFFLNFFIKPERMKKPSFKKTALAYIKSYFIFDLLSTIVGNAIYLSKTE